MIPEASSLRFLPTRSACGDHGPVAVELADAVLLRSFERDGERLLDRDGTFSDSLSKRRTFSVPRWNHDALRWPKARWVRDPKECPILRARHLGGAGNLLRSSLLDWFSIATAHRPVSVRSPRWRRFGPCSRTWSASGVTGAMPWRARVATTRSLAPPSGRSERRVAQVSIPPRYRRREEWHMPRAHVTM